MSACLSFRPCRRYVGVNLYIPVYRVESSRIPQVTIFIESTEENTVNLIEQFENNSPTTSRGSMFTNRSEETPLQARQVRTLSQTEFGLGGVVQNGRTLLFYLLSVVRNGDAIALQKLDSAVATEENEDDPDDPSVWIEHEGLVDEKYSTNNILKDILTFKRSKTSRILHHPVMETFIKQRWKRTKWIFITSLCLYLIFLILYSTFLGLLFFLRHSPEESTAEWRPC